MTTRIVVEPGRPTLRGSWPKLPAAAGQRFRWRPACASGGGWPALPVAAGLRFRWRLACATSDRPHLHNRPCQPTRDYAFAMSVDPALLAAQLTQWLPTRRWYATKHLRPHIERVVITAATGAHAQALAADGIEILEMFVTDHPAPLVTNKSEPEPVIYQVPLVRVEDKTAYDDAAVLGQDHDGRWLIDAAASPDYVRWLLPDVQISATRVLTGEQSNTSIICTVDDGEFGIILKLFRVLAEGSNPDVELQQSLSESGVDRVPRFIAAGWGSWNLGSEVVYGHLFDASEFIDDATDAFRIAVSAAERGDNLDAAGLGRATAEVHLALAANFAAHPADQYAKEALVKSWRARAHEAMDAVPQLHELREQINAVFESTLAPGTEWPPFQRIHGDLHLGQVISSPKRGWILLDFEGEPLRPLAQRRHPDLPLRDLAGILRSFDYAAGPAPSEHGNEWVARHHREFLAGYAEEAGSAGQYAVILNALLLDKALYEARYEAGNRPDWLPIPLRGIHRLLTA